MSFDAGRAVLVMAVAMSLHGCASIVSGRTQSVSFNSEPDGAKVTVNGKTLGTTPMTTLLKKETNQVATFEKDGYRTQTRSLDTRVDGWFWGNIVFGGLFGSTTDNVNGSMYEYSPSQFYVNLVPLNGDSVSGQSGKAKIKDFVVAGYTNLVTDIGRGSGEYLSSLYSLLHVQATQQAGVLANLRSALAAKKPIPDFAEQVATMNVTAIAVAPEPVRPATSAADEAPKAATTPVAKKKSAGPRAH